MFSTGDSDSWNMIAWLEDDSRPLLSERCGTHEKYIAQARAAERLVRGRYLLQDDADRQIAQAEANRVS
jgi:hypothetical protein